VISASLFSASKSPTSTEEAREAIDRGAFAVYAREFRSRYRPEPGPPPEAQENPC